LKDSIEPQRNAGHGTAQNWKATRHLLARVISELKDSSAGKALKSKATHGKAPQSNEKHGTATKSNAARCDFK
jgi:hypothetical protein